MPTKLKIFAVAAALAVGTSGAAMAQYACPPGYAYYGGACQPAAAVPAYPSGPLSGAAVGGQQGAATGGQAAGPVGAIVGGALGTAGGVVAGTTNALTGAPAAPVCAAGYVYYNGGCYPAR